MGIQLDKVLRYAYLRAVLKVIAERYDFAIPSELFKVMCFGRFVLLLNR